MKYIESFFINTYASNAYYSFVDMNGSGSYEMIIQARPNYMQLVLHYHSGVVYGVIYSIREMNALAQNGLFIWAGGIENHGVGQLEFMNGRHYMRNIYDIKQYIEPLAIWKPLEITFATFYYEQSNDITFNFIKNIYNMIDFNITFNLGDVEMRCFYLEQFHRILRLEAPFYVPARFVHSAQYVYINAFGEMDFARGSVWTINGERDYFDPNDFIYLFFDMNGDGTPNLIITNNNRITFVLQYDISADRFYLWEDIGPGRGVILGTAQMRWGGGSNPLVYTYTRLDENANAIITVEVAMKGIPCDINEMRTLFLVALPYFIGYEAIQIPDEIREQSIFLHPGSTPFFEVSEAQFYELAGSFLNNRPTVNDIQDVTFYYHDLFASLNRENVYFSTTSCFNTITLFSTGGLSQIHIQYPQFADFNCASNVAINRLIYNYAVHHASQWGVSLDFLTFRDTWIDAAMTYEIMHHDDYILSINFTGEMTGAGISARGFVEINKGLTIDLVNRKILTLCDFVILEELLENEMDDHVRLHLSLLLNMGEYYKYNNNFYLYNGSIILIVPPPMGSTGNLLIEIDK